MSYSVGRVAELARVTVRTLHHYDEIGLLVPGERTHAGHRRYGDDDLDRLQRILFYRELGFPLEEVALLLDDPATDPCEHLRRQYRVLTERIEQLQKMAAAVKRNMEAQRMGVNLTPEEKFEVFGDHNPEKYEAEAEERWGHTAEYQESQRRVAAFTKDDWRRVMAEHEDLCRRLAEVMASGAAADSAQATDLAEAQRRWVGNYYECGYDMHRCLGDMYASDERFAATYDAFAPGLAVYLRDAIHANADQRAH